jgi:hypothetical protein
MTMSRSSSSSTTSGDAAVTPICVWEDDSPAADSFLGRAPKQQLHLPLSLSQLLSLTQELGTAIMGHFCC